MLSKSICHILVSVFISMGLTSCITYTYTETNYLLDDIDQVASDVGYGSDKLPFEMRPSDMQSPAFNKKGQFYADGSITGNVTSGQGYGAAYAITDNALLMARYSSYKRKGSSEDDVTYLEAYYTVTEFEVENAAIVDETIIYAGDTSGMFEYTRTNQFDAKHGEIGYGRFKQLKNDLRNEWISGVGWGTAHTEYSLWLLGAPFNYSEKRNYYNLFVQDDFSWVKKHYQATAIGRFNTYLFKDRTLNMTGKYIEPEYRKSAFSLEGAMRLSAGFRFAKVYLQYAGVLPIASKEIEWFNTELKAGLIIQIGK